MFRKRITYAKTDLRPVHALGRIHVRQLPAVGSTYNLSQDLATNIKNHKVWHIEK